MQPDQTLEGSQGCQKMRQDPLNMPYEVWCANIAPKLKNIQKTLRKQGFLMIFFSILTAFCSFYNLRAILAQKENSFICRKKNVIFWHPWDPWGRVNSGKKFFWVQTASVSKLVQMSNICQKLDLKISEINRS